MYRIMIIEDEADVREELALVLKNAGYTPIPVDNFEEIESRVRELEPDLILLDVNLPGKSGFSWCVKIRKRSQVPIIFVTSQNTAMDEVQALSLGGDDFISKPYNIPVLMVRIQALLKRAGKDSGSDRMFHRGVELHAATGEVSYEGKQAELTRNELKILYQLFRNKGKITSREDLIEFLWDNQIYVDDNTLSVHVTRIREKLRQIGVKSFIETKRGMGYKI